jgi:hypothetical protein
MVPEIVQEGSAVLNVAFDRLTERGIDRRQVRASNGVHNRRWASRHGHMLSPSSANLVVSARIVARHAIP